jgi:hypothetical protein
MENNEFSEIIKTLEERVLQSDATEPNFRKRTLTAINLYASAYNQLREAVLTFGLGSQEEEIYFFKVTKPSVLEGYLYYSKLLTIYSKLLTIEAKRPVTSIKARKKHLKKTISEAQHFYNEYPEFYQYYRSGSVHLDDKYFVRTETGYCLDCHHFIVEPHFSTSHDYILAAIKAYEKITEYCKSEIRNLKSGKPFISKDGCVSIISAHKWTGSNRELLELIYGVHTLGTIDHGNITIKQMVEIAEALLNIKLTNYYNDWSEMRGRKKSRLPFLERMIKRLLRRMDDADEK